MDNTTLNDAVGCHPGMSPKGKNGFAYKNLNFTYEVNRTSLLLVCHQGAPASLHIAPVADSLGGSDDKKSGAVDFDKKFVISDAAGQAKKMLNKDVQALLEAMEPFTEIEFADDMIRLLKQPTDEVTAIRDIERMGKIAQAVNATAAAKG